MQTLTSSKLDIDILKRAFQLMATAKAMTELYEENSSVTSKYVHATSRGHEAIQIALGLQLTEHDYLSAYYRDDSILLAIGMEPYELMLQLLAKREDPFSGGRTYYSHPSLRREAMPKIPHQSSATGMQAIPTTGAALGIQYLKGKNKYIDNQPIVVCSLGDASITEGEVSEAFQMAVLKKLPILYLVQDNEWDISASADEIRAQDATHYAKGFKSMEVRTIDGTDFEKSYLTVQQCLKELRQGSGPYLIHAKVPLLNHHTSGVRKEFYRSAEDLALHAKRDPYPKLRKALLKAGLSDAQLQAIEEQAKNKVAADYQRALQAEDPRPEDLFTHEFAPTPITEERGVRSPEGASPTLMVDCALFAIRELMSEHEECLLYGQDVGARLGGVFREAATLAAQFGDDRVFNTPIQEAFIIGSTVGMSAVGLRPVVEVQFADYIWPGLNQLFTEVSRSCFLSNGKWPVSCVIRVPIGAYGSGGPYHSSSVESVLCNIKGIKVCYPSNGADLKGLIKAAYYDPNPVLMLEHKGLYWSKVRGTAEAKVPEPSSDYVVPIGKARVALQADNSLAAKGKTLSVITYGMGVHWAKNAAKKFHGAIEVIDLRTLYPLDEEMVFESVRKHSKCLVLTEEPVNNSFAQSLAGRIQAACFQWLDAPIKVVGSENLPAIPLNSTLEATMLPSIEKVELALQELLNY